MHKNADSAGEREALLPPLLDPRLLSQWLYRAMQFFGWRVDYQGLPAKQGIFVVYPHTSNWDFPIAVTCKFALNIPIAFWGKDSLFKIPLFARWLRSFGGIPIDRTSSQGVVGQMVEQFLACKASDTTLWLALSPEGTRQYSAGWRSGFYRTALLAQVPLCLVHLDYSSKTIRLRDFYTLTGDEASDMQAIAAIFAGVQGCRPGQAAPVVLLKDKMTPMSKTDQETA